MGTIVVPRPGWKVKSRITQMSKIEMMPTGRAMKNHMPHDGWGSMICSATMFCGDAIGESIPRYDCGSSTWLEGQE